MPPVATVELQCPSGIAGNMWLAAALALGAEAQPLFDLPAVLRLGDARLEWTADGSSGVVCTDLEVVDVDPGIDGTFADLTDRIAGTDLPARVREVATAVAERRCEGDAGTPFAGRRWWGEEFTDTLIDVVGGVLAWYQLGEPAVVTRGPVALGGAALPGLDEVLGPITHVGGGPPVALTTATGAALLRQFWQPGTASGESVRRCAVHSAFVRRFDLTPMAAALHA